MKRLKKMTLRPYSELSNHELRKIVGGADSEIIVDNPAINACSGKKTGDKCQYHLRFLGGTTYYYYGYCRSNGGGMVCSSEPIPSGPVNPN